MGVYLTDHAILRCKQQGINPNMVRDRLKEFPQFEGNLMWQLSAGCQVVLKQADNGIVVITVIGLRKINKFKERRRKRL